MAVLRAQSRPFSTIQHQADRAALVEERGKLKAEKESAEAELAKNQAASAC